MRAVAVTVAAAALLVAAAQGAAPPRLAGTIAFARSGAGHGIWLVRPDGSNLRRIANVGGAYGLAWSEDGTRLLFGRSGGGGSGIWIVNRDGSGLVHVSGGSQPTWAPGGRIAWVVNFRGACIRSENLDGTDKRDVYCTGSGPLALVQRPQWSPDRTRLAWLEPNPDEARPSGTFTIADQIRVGGADGAGATAVPLDGSIRDFHWSPNGTQFVYKVVRGRTYDGVWIARVDGGAPRRLRLNATSPAWSPDGRHTVALWDDGLFTMDTSGGHVVRIPGTTDADDGPA